MRVLVTGCAGFIGSHLTEAVLEAGDDVVGVDCFNDNYGRAQKLANLRHVRDWGAFEFVPIDLGQGDLAEIVDGCDTVFHLAAEPGVRAGWGPRYGRFLHNNVLATQRLLEAVREHPGTRLVHASSSSVYGESTVRPTPEDAPLRPASPYGQTKLSAEHLCSIYGRAYGVEWVGLRYFTVYGPRQRPDMALHTFCQAALDGRPVTVFGDGGQTRDFTYVADIVAATLAAVHTTSAAGQVFNVGGGSPTSIRSVLDLLAAVSGHSLDIRHLPHQPGDVRDTAADTALARDQLGYAPATTFEDGFGREFEWVAGVARVSSRRGSSGGSRRPYA